MTAGLEIAYEHPYSKAIWPITTDLLNSVYLVPRQKTEFDVASALGKQASMWPWAQSYSVSRTETIASIERSLRDLMLSTESLIPDDLDLSALDPQSRVFRHVSALKQLWILLDGALPDELWTIRHVLRSNAADALEALPIVADADVPRPRAYLRLLQTLERHHGRASEDAHAKWRKEKGTLTLGARPECLLGHVQREMLATAPDRLTADGSITSYAVRDSAMETDLAASMIQKWLNTDLALSPADFGLLIPATAEYQRLTAASFRKAGIPLSGLSVAPERRDMAHEVVYLFLLARRIPPATMAAASLMLSPLMPWSQSAGLELSKAIMAGQETWKIASALDPKSEKLLKMVRSGGVSNPAALSTELAFLSSSLTNAVEFNAETKTARELIGRVDVVLKAANPLGTIEWESVIPMAAPSASVSTVTPQKYTRSVTVMGEGQEPWRPVRHLFVLGFADGAYPAPASANPFLLDSEIHILRSECGITVPPRAEILAERISQFQRQIGTASGSLTLLCPQRTLEGKERAAASTLPFITRCIDGIESPDDFVRACNEIADIDWPDNIPRVLETKSQRFAPAPSPINSIQLGRDLFSIRRKEDGTSRPQSPSRLETLIVSPFAWLLSELDATHAYWEPETVDVMKKGTIAHDVFERLFEPGGALPSESEINARLSSLVEQCIGRTAPFMLGSHWKSERDTLEAEIGRAARNWRNALMLQGAKVINNEFWLKGHVLGIDIHGKVDCLLQFENGQLVIVDHKKSGTRNREARLNAGWDLQVELYKQMSATHPDPKTDDPENANTKTRALLAEANSIGVAYHLMNDSGILLNAAQVSKVDASMAQIDKDISVNAVSKLLDEVVRLRKGEIRLNRTSDRKFFSDVANMGLYAFDISPLIDLYSTESDADLEDGDDE